MPGGGFRILFAGGGTGGHVFPGIALAQHASGSAVHWLCTSRAFDAAQLAQENIPFEALESPRWRGFGGFLAPMARAILASARRIREFKPDVLVGVGGYGTVPPVIAAKLLGLPYVLLEQNIRPGKANRFLAPGAARLYVQWAQARSAFPGCGSRVLVTGSPLRKQLRRVPRDQALRRFGLGDVLPTLAVVGGSQGAEALNQGVVEALNGTATRLQIIHVTGKTQVDAVRGAYESKGARAVVLDFVSDMDSLYSAADLVVSRAGAMAIAELAAFGTPSVLVPIARSSGDHQRENARAVARGGGAFLLEERDGLAGGLAPILEKLVGRDPVFDAMKAKLSPLAKPGAADVILSDLEKLVA
ncbi:MAG TPA: UDP-N-acetylglucosamine--N-acetylmuramyl-(pentapeptide) pyrophosphoryl-undecaprenol N-acetylglucosamine transferase [Planctomycetota bacterium]|nr:UDP-N-acetylglucosamine--N-acetylmuramyl-(pentapeptide) pyrophosphoryl-undecaprenol N-acetylglucosamine transferase [Planctomycetota bacterium]